MAVAIFLLCCLLCLLFICWRRNKQAEEHEKTEEELQAAAGYAEERKTTGYNEYETNVNTAPQMAEPDHYGDEAKEEVELEAVDKQYTLDGVAGTGATGNKGDEAVLDMLADGHETGAASGGDKAVDSQGVCFSQYK